MPTNHALTVFLGRALRALPHIVVAALILHLSVPEAHAQGMTHRMPGAASPASARAVEATIRALFAAAERNDVAALDTLYAGDSLTVVEGAGINRGWSDYRDHHLMPEMKEMKNFRYRPSEISVQVAGEMAWAEFRYALQADVKGRAVDVVGRGTAILMQKVPMRAGETAGQWVVRHTQTSARPRRPADPAMPDVVPDRSSRR